MEIVAHNRKVVRAFARVFPNSEEWIRRFNSGNMSFKYAMHEQLLQPPPRKGKLPPLPHYCAKRQPITHDYEYSGVDPTIVQTLGEALHSKGITWLFSDDARNIGQFVSFHHEGKCFLPITEIPHEQRNYHPDVLDIWICPVNPPVSQARSISTYAPTKLHQTPDANKISEDYLLSNSQQLECNWKQLVAVDIRKNNYT